MFNRMAYALILISGLIYPQSLQIEAPSVLWSKSFGGTSSDDAYSVRLTNDGGFVTIGSTSSDGLGGSDFWIVRFDSLGTILWSKAIGFIELEHAYDGRETFNGDFILTGSSNSTDSTSYDLLLVRTDSSGDSLWTNMYGTAGYECGKAIIQVPNGDFVIAGETGTTVTGEKDFYLIKTNPTGGLKWSQTTGGTADDKAEDLCRTSDNKYLVAGATRSYGAGHYDIWLVCYDPSGTVLWNRTYGSEQEDYALGIVQTSDSGCAVSGYTYSYGAGNADAFLLRLNKDGDTLWAKTFGTADEHEVGYSLVRTNDGGFIITGTAVNQAEFTQKLLVIRTDSLGNLVWKKIIEAGAFSYGYSIRRVPGDGYVISGVTYPDEDAEADGLLIRLDAEQPVALEGEEVNLVSEYRLFQNYPNPFNPSTNFGFRISDFGFVSLKVYDLLGREVATVVEKELSPGEYHFPFSFAEGGSHFPLSGGVYFYRLKAGNFSETKKFILLK